MVHQWKSAGETVFFVPTMGALHDGHLSLVRQAKSEGARVVVSIFVNPLQFGPTEDFARYPRTLKDDVEKLKTVDADVVFAPSAAEIYPAGFQTTLHNKQMANGLCGKVRPGHFDGMLTVVLKLLNIVSPDVALFGKKDYQQWRLIERMARDLDVPVEIRGCDTIREKDGLAMSSRNERLSESARKEAKFIHKILLQAKEKFILNSAPEVTKFVVSEFKKHKNFTLEYFDIADEETLLTCKRKIKSKNYRGFIAVFIENIRFRKENYHKNKRKTFRCN